MGIGGWFCSSSCNRSRVLNKSSGSWLGAARRKSASRPQGALPAHWPDTAEVLLRVPEKAQAGPAEGALWSGPRACPRHS